MTFSIDDALRLLQPDELTSELVAMIIGSAATIGFQSARRAIRRWRLKKGLKGFFGASAAKIFLVHSSIFDMPDQAYNVPATDTKAARCLAKLFEGVGLRDGVEFEIMSDRQAANIENLWDGNVALICGPARNRVFRDLVTALSGTSMRYEMTVNHGSRNVLIDKERRQQLRSSRERGDETGGRFDYGLIASLPNPRNNERQLVIFAGIHGTGTVGAAQFVVDNLKLLESRRNRKVVCEVVRADYLDDIETPTGVRLV